MNLCAAAKSHRSRSLVCCSSSDSSAEIAELSRPADFTTAQSDQSMTSSSCVDLVPGALIVISGYWIGPDMDDGCGSVEAMLQRILWYLLLWLTREMFSGIWRYITFIKASTRPYMVIFPFKSHIFPSAPKLSSVPLFTTILTWYCKWDDPYLIICNWNSYEPIVFWCCKDQSSIFVLVLTRP